MALRLTILIITIFIANAVYSQDDLHKFDTENQRKSYVTLSTELRCPKCQNQNLADSHSEISVTMRDVIAEELLAGKNEEEIKSMMVERYGDFVLYKPPVNNQTLLLWWAPIIFILLVFIALVYVIAKRSKYVDDEEYSEAEIDKPDATSNVSTKIDSDIDRESD